MTTGSADRHGNFIDKNSDDDASDGGGGSSRDPLATFAADCQTTSHPTRLFPVQTASSILDTRAQALSISSLLVDAGSFYFTKSDRFLDFLLFPCRHVSLFFFPFSYRRRGDFRARQTRQAVMIRSLPLSILPSFLSLDSLANESTRIHKSYFSFSLYFSSTRSI